MPGFSLLLAGMFGELMIAPLFGRSGGGLGPARVITAVMLLAALSVVGGPCGARALHRRDDRARAGELLERLIRRWSPPRRRVSCSSATPSASLSGTFRGIRQSRST